MRTFVISVSLQGEQFKNYNQDEFLQLECSLSALSIKRNLALRLVKSDPAFFISKGHLHDIRNYISDNDIGLLLIDNTLTPIQQRNLEKKLMTKVPVMNDCLDNKYNSIAESYRKEKSPLTVFPSPGTCTKSDNIIARIKKYWP